MPRLSLSHSAPTARGCSASSPASPRSTAALRSRIARFALAVLAALATVGASLPAAQAQDELSDYESQLEAIRAPAITGPSAEEVSSCELASIGLELKLHAYNSCMVDWYLEWGGDLPDFLQAFAEQGRDELAWAVGRRNGHLRMTGSCSSLTGPSILARACSEEWSDYCGFVEETHRVEEVLIEGNPGDAPIDQVYRDIPVCNECLYVEGLAGYSWQGGPGRGEEVAEYADVGGYIECEDVLRDGEMEPYWLDGYELECPDWLVALVGDGCYELQESLDFVD